MESMGRLDIPLLLDDIGQGGDNPSSLGSGTELLTCLDYIEGVHELSDQSRSHAPASLRNKSTYQELGTSYSSAQSRILFNVSK
jgi:hypothetical protein